MRAFLFLIGAVLAARGAWAQSVAYTVTPVVESGALKALDVEMSFAGESDGATAIELPDSWGGKSELWRGLSALQVSGDGAKFEVGGDAARKVIRHAGGAALKLRYRLTQFWSGEPAANNTNEYRPVIRPGYFHVIGWTAFVRPQWSLATPVSVSFKGLPKGWGFASDLEHGSLSIADLLQSVSVGGDFRVLRAGKLRVAIRGAWSFRDEDFIKRLEPIIASHHRFWGDPPGAFLVTVLPLKAEPGHMSVGGTSLGDAFAFLATAHAENVQLTRVLAHEHLHSWIPVRLGLMPPENETVEYWFSEGVTDFYTYRLLTRDGLSSVEETVSALNEIMWAYAFSPVREAPNAKLAAEFWRSREMNELPYQRGSLIAALADARVRQASGGRQDLDDVVLEMKRATAAVGEGGMPPPIRALFLKTMKGAGVDFEDEVARFVEKGESVRLPADVWGPCGVVETSEVAEFDRGFDAEATLANGNKAVGVDPDGPAYAAGLRDGMVIHKLSYGERGDSRKPLTYEIIEDGEMRKITYLPEGKRRVTLQELKLRALDEAGRKACAMRLGGMN